MKIDNITDFIKSILKYLAGIFMIVLGISVVAIIASRCHRSVIDIVVKYVLIIICGLCMSMVLHELSHYITMKMCGIKHVRVETTLFRFSVSTDEEIYGKKLFIIAASGVCSTCTIASVLCGINQFINNDVINVIMWIYYIHLINILPFFGDGKMLLKALLTMKVKDV